MNGQPVFKEPAGSIEEWMHMARFCEQQWRWFEAAYRELIGDLLHNTDHQDKPPREIDLSVLLQKLLGPTEQEGADEPSAKVQ